VLSHLLPPDLSQKETAQKSNGMPAPREIATSAAGSTGSTAAFL